MLQFGILPESAYQQASLQELQQEAIYRVLAVVMTAGLALIVSAELFRLSTNESVTGLILVLLSLLTWLLLRRSYLAGAWLLVGGVIVANLLALQGHPHSSLSALLALPTGLAIFFISQRSGVFVATVSSLFVVFGAQSLSSSQEALNQMVALITIWGVLGLIWVAVRPTQQAIQWSWASYERARQLLEEARGQRVELKQIQEDLIAANQQLARLFDRLKAMHQVTEEARQAKEQFVANVSHELRTPLNMIIGFSELISQAPQIYGMKLPAALLADIAAIQRNSEHLSSLVNDVLDLSQVDAGRMALSKEWISIPEVIWTAIEAVNTLYRSKGLDLEVHVEPNLPPLFCDETRIRQVLLNLLSNAGRFTERGHIRIEARRDDSNILLSVADTGPGISLEKQAKLFEPFQQVDASIRRRHGGSGLGLSISKRFVEMHDGKMWLESEAGVGTRVYFSLPLEASPPTSPTDNIINRWFSPYHQYEARTRHSKAPAPQIAPRFLLIEEGKTLQRLFSRYLDGAELVSVASADEARNVLNQTPAHAVIINDPLLNETPNLIKQLSDLPFGTVAVSCWVPGEDTAARELGVASYLVKPVTRESLISALDRLGDSVKTVVLADDEPEALQLFTRMLASAPRNYKVLWATDGERALRLLRARRPDAMVLDLAMPQMDGFEVLRRKSEDPELRSIPVVVVSARDPLGELIVGDSLTIARGGGLSVRSLLTCIQAVTAAWYPSAIKAVTAQSGDRAFSKKALS